MQLNSKGDEIPPEDWQHIVLQNTDDLPMPTIEMTNVGSAARLFCALKGALHTDSYMAALMMGGVAVMAVHYAEVRHAFHQVPIPLLLGPPNTGKSLLARVAAALVGGLHEEGTGIFHNLSMARMVDLLGTVKFFVYNDPEKMDVLKTLITKGFEEGKSSNLLRESSPNTLPAVTANPFLLRALSKKHGKREISRLLILPITRQADCLLESDVDRYLGTAGQSIGEIVSVRGRMEGSVGRVRALTERIEDLLPQGDTSCRIAQNYAQVLVATELFVDVCQIQATQAELWQYLEEILIPRSIDAHQLQVETSCGASLDEFLAQALRQLPADVFVEHVRLVHNGLDLAVRLKTLVDVMSSSNTQQKFEVEPLKAAFGQRGDSVRFGRRVLSAYLIDVNRLDEVLMRDIICSMIM